MRSLSALLSTCLRCMVVGSSTLVICACYGGPATVGEAVPTISKRISVFDADQKPILGIRLTLKWSGGTREVFTDSFGAAIFNLLFKAGEIYTLTADDVDGPNQGGPYQAQTITMKNDGNENLNLTLTLVLSPSSQLMEGHPSRDRGDLLQDPTPNPKGRD